MSKWSGLLDRLSTPVIIICIQSIIVCNNGKWLLKCFQMSDFIIFVFCMHYIIFMNFRIMWTRFSQRWTETLPFWDEMKYLTVDEKRSLIQLPCPIYYSIMCGNSPHISLSSLNPPPKKTPQKTPEVVLKIHPECKGFSNTQ